jgi:hypothetical protein
MPHAADEKARKDIAANRGSLIRLMHGEEPQLLAELRAVLPQIPADRTTIELYVPPPGHEEESPITHTWLLGPTGELLIESVEGEVQLTWFGERHEPAGYLDRISSGPILAIISKTILRYRAAGHRIQ